jgi:small subunit ribosomal protein S6
MSTYETIFILRAALSDDEAAKTVDKVKGIIEKLGGSVLKVENWGRRKLAYEVKKEKKGNYILIQFKGEGKLIAELEHNYRVDDNIIKFITTKLTQPLTSRPAPPTEEKAAAEAEEKA